MKGGREGEGEGRSGREGWGERGRCGAVTGVGGADGGERREDAREHLRRRRPATLRRQRRACYGNAWVQAPADGEAFSFVARRAMEYRKAEYRML